jgi:TorA maturation chaperone TorD
LTKEEGFGMQVTKKVMLLPLLVGALFLAAPASAQVEEIFAAEGKDAAKAYCESLKEAAQEGTEEEKEAA